MAAHPAARKRNIAATSGQPDLWRVHRVDTRKQEVLASAARPSALSCGRSPSTGYGCSRSRRTRRSRSATRCRTSASGAPPSAPGPAGLAPAPLHADHPPRGGRWCCGLLSCTMPCSCAACWAVSVPCCNSMGAWHARQSEPFPVQGAACAMCDRAHCSAHAHGTAECRMDRDRSHAAVQLERGAAQAFRRALAPEGTARPNTQRAAVSAHALTCALTDFRESSHGHSPCTQRRATRSGVFV